VTLGGFEGTEVGVVEHHPHAFGHVRQIKYVMSSRDATPWVQYPMACQSSHSWFWSTHVSAVYWGANHGVGRELVGGSVGMNGIVGAGVVVVAVSVTRLVSIWSVLPPPPIPLPLPSITLTPPVA